MLPTVEGIIARRILLNYRADPAVVRCLVPRPLEVAVERGAAVVGICLIRLENLRPRGIPAALGIRTENMAHRVAVRYPTATGWQDGVFIWRRESDRDLIVRLGGRLFPGVHYPASFCIREAFPQIELAVGTVDGAADVFLRSEEIQDWPGSTLFPTFDDVTRFFQRGDCGFSCAREENRLEAIRLVSRDWRMTPLRLFELHSAFFDSASRFPRGTLHFDSAVLMRAIRHQWCGVPTKELPAALATDSR